MAFVCKMNPGRAVLRISPGKEAVNALASPLNEPDEDELRRYYEHDANGYYQYVDDVLHAIYVDEGKLWLRIGDSETSVEHPIDADVVMDEKNKCVVTKFEWPGSSKMVVIRETIPDLLLLDPTFDYMAAYDTFFGYLFKDWVKSAQDISEAIANLSP